jgi:cytoskeletal protein CcmA (bactofilin family)
MASRIDDISINSLLGNGSAIVGNIKVNGFIRIDGDIDGNLETEGNIIISENARIRGNVNAKSAVIAGIIVGNIYVSDNVKLLPSSVVIGDVLSKRIQIEDKVIIHGHCISIKDEKRYEEEVVKYNQEKSIKEKASFNE